MPTLGLLRLKVTKRLAKVTARGEGRRTCLAGSKASVLLRHAVALLGVTAVQAGRSSGERPWLCAYWGRG